MATAPAGQHSLTPWRERLPWARRRLRIPADAQAGAVRGLLLARLADDDFFPPEDSHQAISLLAERDDVTAFVGTGRDEFLRATEEKLGEDVAEFAGQFFEIPPVERRRRFELLATTCRFSPLLAARIDALRAGVDVDLAEVAGCDPPVAPLARHIGRLFVLRPGPRAALRRELLGTMKPHGDHWPSAARRLRVRLPAVAALAPDFVRRLVEPAGLRRRPAAGHLPTTEHEPSQRHSLWWVVMLIILGLGLLRGYTRQHKPPPAPRCPAVPDRYEIPKAPLFDIEQFRKQLESDRTRDTDKPELWKRWEKFEERKRQIEREQRDGPEGKPGDPEKPRPPRGDPVGPGEVPGVAVETIVR